MIMVLISKPSVLVEITSGTISKMSAFIHGGKFDVSQKALNSASIRNFANFIAIRAFLKSPILGVGLGTTRGYGVIPGMLVNFGILGLITYILFLKRVFHFTLKNKKILLVIILIYLGSILSVWYSYYFAFIPLYACFSKEITDVPRSDGNNKQRITGKV